ncbi:hypothetical protein, partial [Sulfitobacter sp.]|uniref:hypothetical protein n=1 Tax=Sulfitobacter sp. TaxID=1903071 RepID=UPI00356292FB
GMKNSQQIPRVAAILWHLSTISIQAKVLSIGARDRLTAQKSSIFSPKPACPAHSPHPESRLLSPDAAFGAWGSPNRQPFSKSLVLYRF